MKWMTIGYLKMHSRIDYDCEDALLDQYGTAAEEFVLAYMGRTYENLLDIYGEIPARLYECVQLLVDNMYQNRSMVSMTNMSMVPYTFDAMISDFVRHTEETPIEAEKETLEVKLATLTYNFMFAVADLPRTDEIEAIEHQCGNLEILYRDVAATPYTCAQLRQSLATLSEACQPYLDHEVNQNN